MNLEKELEELRKRVDRLEIEQQSGKMKQDKLDIVIEQLANFAKLQMDYTHELSRDMKEMKNDLRDLKGVKDELRELRKKVDDLTDYLKNPPANGH